MGAKGGRVIVAAILTYATTLSKAVPSYTAYMMFENRLGISTDYERSLNTKVVDKMLIGFWRVVDTRVHVLSRHSCAVDQQG